MTERRKLLRALAAFAGASIASSMSIQAPISISARRWSARVTASIRTRVALSSSSASVSRRRISRAQSLRSGVARSTRHSRKAAAASGRPSDGGRTSVSSE